MLYNIFIKIYGIAIRLAALVHYKAKAWQNGRKNIFEKLHSVVRGPQVYWFHCASLGEYEQALPLIEKLKEKNSELYVLVTFFSPSGFLHYKKSNAVNEYSYLPLDTPKNAAQFIAVVKPTKVFFIKYEFWYNYLFKLRLQSIPTFLVSGIFRKDQVFFKPYNHFFKKGLNCFTSLFVQNEESKTLLNAIGIYKVLVTGDTRFDRVISNKQKIFNNYVIEQFIAKSRVIIAGSTWDKDEDLLRDLLKLLSDKNDWKLIIAPHEVTEEAIVRIRSKFNEPVLFYSEVNSMVTDARVLVLDTMGMLSYVYRYATICYVGGGFGRGIHNTLEAVVYEHPVFFWT